MSGVLVGVAIGAVLALGTWILAGMGLRRDRDTVYRWLLNNTKDSPGESHVGTVEVAKGTGLTEERTKRACLADPRIHRASGDVDSWSVWRKEPQSVYDTRGITYL